jgi:putative copper resistance protein D
VTGWGLPVLRLAGEVAAVGTIGLLLTGAVLVAGPHELSTPVASAAVRASSRWAAAWCGSAAGLLLLTASNTTGVPLTDLSLGAVARELTTGQGRALLVVTALSGAVAAGARRNRAPRAGRLWLAVGLTGLLPTTVTGHAATAADHDLATRAVVVHVVAATLWLGGLLAVLLRLRRHPALLSHAVARYSSVALACFVAVGLSGAISAWLHLGQPSRAWLSGYGGLLLGKAVALLLLGAFGWQHRRRTLPALAAGRPRAFLAFAGAELSVMGAALGLAVALSRTPMPVVGPGMPMAGHGTGLGTPTTTVEPLTPIRLIVEWRPDALVLVLLGLLLAAYITAVRTVQASGGRWPTWRLVAFAAGTSVALVALCGGLAIRAPAQVSAQLTQFVLLLLVAPALLVHGAPFTLRSLVRRPAVHGPAEPPCEESRAARALTDPLLAALLATVLVLALYRTPVIELSLRSSWVHLLFNVLALGVGVLVLRPVADPLPSDGAAAERALPLLAVAVTLALLAGQLGLGDQLLAGRWFLGLDRSGIDPVEDQRLGALVVASTATAVLLLAVSVAIRPRRREPHVQVDVGRSGRTAQRPAAAVAAEPGSACRAAPSAPPATGRRTPCRPRSAAPSRRAGRAALRRRSGCRRPGGPAVRRRRSAGPRPTQSTAGGTPPARGPNTQ